jgi:hypothetical protein
MKESKQFVGPMPALVVGMVYYAVAQRAKRNHVKLPVRSLTTGDDVWSFHIERSIFKITHQKNANNATVARDKIRAMRADVDKLDRILSEPVAAGLTKKELEVRSERREQYVRERRSLEYRIEQLTPEAEVTVRKWDIDLNMVSNSEAFVLLEPSVAPKLKPVELNQQDPGDVDDAENVNQKSSEKGSKAAK